MADETGALGPISYLIVEFPGNKMTGEGFATLLDLVDRGVIRILDLKFVTRDSDGSMRALELQDIDHDGQFDLAVFASASSGLLGESDLSEAASVIEPGSAAGILISRTAGRRPSSRRCIVARPSSSLRYIPRTTLSRRSMPPKADRKKKGRRHATSPWNRTHRSHRRDGHCRVEPCLTPAAKSVGTTRPTAIRATTANAQQPPPAPAPEPIAQLKELGELKSRGILTEAEFDAQKAKILPRPERPDVGQPRSPSQSSLRQPGQGVWRVVSDSSRSRLPGAIGSPGTQMPDSECLRPEVTNSVRSPHRLRISKRCCGRQATKPIAPTTIMAMA